MARASPRACGGLVVTRNKPPDPPVHITATFSESDASLVIVYPGPDVAKILFEVMREGIEPYPSPSRREQRGPLEEPHLSRLLHHATVIVMSGDSYRNPPPGKR